MENSQLSEKLSEAEAEIAQLKELAERASNNTDSVNKLEKYKKNEKVLRMELAQLRSELARKNSKEKHLEDHVTSLEEQVNKLVADYESKLQKQHANKRIHPTTTRSPTSGKVADDMAI